LTEQGKPKECNGKPKGVRDTVVARAQIKKKREKEDHRIAMMKMDG